MKDKTWTLIKQTKKMIKWECGEWELGISSYKEDGNYKEGENIYIIAYSAVDKRFNAMFDIRTKQVFYRIPSIQGNIISLNEQLKTINEFMQLIEEAKHLIKKEVNIEF